MFFRSRHHLRCLLACLATSVPMPLSASAQDTAADAIKLVSKVEPVEFARPGVLPDRIVLTWAGDPATTQAVTWRTSTDVNRGLAEITVASAGPDLESESKQLIAVSQPLTTDLNTAHFHTVKFEGLTPKTRYAYRVGDGVNWSEWFQFTTASTEPEPFSFIYFGDAQNDIRSRWSRVIREAYRDAPKAAFLLHAGDLINRAESDVEWQEWFEAGEWMNGMMPSVAVPGNHEMAKNEDGSRRVSHHWRPQFAFPENGPEGLEEACYTLVYQGVRIIGMNSNEKPTEQAEWLDQVLTENKEKWVVCTFHHPMFSTGKDRDNAELRAIWKPVLDKHRVDLVLQGHDHTYGRTGLDTPMGHVNLSTGLNAADVFSGTVYVVSVSGPKMYGLQQHPFMPRRAENTQLYQIIHISGDKLHFEAFMANGELYDAFTLEKQTGQPNKLTEQIPDIPERVKPPVAAVPDRASAVFAR
ncbi:MAG: metallophosphoesterase family protein [Planctomycetaceae bacterium]|nr:metallophosphoesterase family protein [Planctomycetaceae bacterium]